jgi:hypothetical protein
LTEQQLKILEFELRDRFYYVEYPDPIPVQFWKDRLGELHFISEMGLDHLKASVKLVERDIAYLEDSGRNSVVIAAILPHAQEKLSRLKDEFRRKAQI